MGTVQAQGQSRGPDSNTPERPATQVPPTWPSCTDTLAIPWGSQEGALPHDGEPHTLSRQVRLALAGPRLTAQGGQDG